MATFKIRYFTTRPGKQGKGPRYFWQPSSDLITAGWKVQRLSDDMHDAKKEAEGYNRDLDAWRNGLRGADVVNAQQGSIEALINLYKSSHRYLERSPKTRNGYDYAFRIIRGWAADVPVVAITPRLVQMFYASMREKYPAKAAATVRVLRLLLQHAIREDMIVNNPAARPGISVKAKKGMPWTTAHVDAFVEAADRLGHYSIGTAVFINQWLGQRLGDIVSLRVDTYQDGKIIKRQNKTGAEVSLPVDMVPALKKRIELQLEKNRQAEIPSLLLLPNDGGTAYSPGWFSHLFARIRAKAAAEIHEAAAAAGETIGKDHPLHDFDKLIFKDLRHTAVTRLAEAGAPTPMIASITGHSFRTCEEIIDRYNIRTSKMAEEAFRLRLAAER